jgi:hypothetical protein
MLHVNHWYLTIVAAYSTLLQKILIMQLRLTTLLGLLLFISCKHDAYIEPPVLPSVLIFSPDTLNTQAGSATYSGVPTINGTKPIQFKLTVSPATTEIEIDSTGKISTKAGLLFGTYKVSVTATNAAGTASFPDIFTIVASEVITFSNHMKPLMQATCNPCHVFAGGALTNYTDYNTTKSRVNWILDRVKKSPSATGYMPQGKPPLTAAQIGLIDEWVAQGLKQ